MTTETRTREAVGGYHAAWTSGDVGAAAGYLADEVANPTPLNGYDDTPRPVAEYVAALGAFGRIVTGATLMSELYGEGEATLVYDVHTTTPVGSVRSAEHFRLSGDRISSILLIFDATAWHAMRASQGS